MVLVVGILSSHHVFSQLCHLSRLLYVDDVVMNWPKRGNWGVSAGEDVVCVDLNVRTEKSDTHMSVLP